MTLPSENIRIALAQVFPTSEGAKGDSGLNKLAEYTHKASKQGADVVVFPEYFLFGASHEAWKNVRNNGPSMIALHAVEEKDEQHWLAHVSTVAREANIDIVMGTVVETYYHRSEEREDDSAQVPLYNTAYYVDRLGTVKGRYTKRRLWHPERSVLTPGHDHTHPSPRLFEITTRAGLTLRASILICWDLAFPEAFRELLVDSRDGLNKSPMVGPDIVFAPTCWYATDAGPKGLGWNRDSEASLLDSLCTARAYENECIIAMCNVAGPQWPSVNVTSQENAENDSIVGVGRSCVNAPFLGCVARAESPEETLVTATINTKLLQDARETYRIRYDLGSAASKV